MHQFELVTNEPLGSPETLSQPHFDDEATLLAAQPVVPLAAVRSQATAKRSMLLGAGIVIAVLVGALCASLLYSNQNEPASQEVITVSDGAAAGAVAPVSQTIANSEPVVAPEPTQTDKQAAENRKTAPVDVEKRSPARDVKANAAKIDSSARDNMDSRPRRVENPPAVYDSTDDARVPDSYSAERDRRRQERREARRHKRQNAANEELFRIREIFEGSRERRP
jgi:hypothetical protein